jgi:hypothetical protein
MNDALRKWTLFMGATVTHGKDLILASTKYCDITVIAVYYPCPHPWNILQIANLRPVRH